jgi:hypothetical protein
VTRIVKISVENPPHTENRGKRGDFEPREEVE